MTTTAISISQTTFITSYPVTITATQQITTTAISLQPTTIISTQLASTVTQQITTTQVSTATVTTISQVTQTLTSSYAITSTLISTAPGMFCLLHSIENSLEFSRSPVWGASDKIISRMQFLPKNRALENLPRGPMRAAVNLSEILSGRLPTCPILIYYSAPAFRSEYLANA